MALAIGGIFAGLALLMHVYIFVLESVRWTQPGTRRIFGVGSEQDAITMKSLAFNQGFYNLFLALIVLVGIVFVIFGMYPAGYALLLAGLGSMLAAALVLVIADRSKIRAALVQGTFPLVAVILLIWEIVA